MKPLPNENYVNVEKLKIEFPKILNALSIFIETKKNFPNLEELVKGECATLIRRHIPFLTRTSIGFNVKNIDNVYLDRDNSKILYFRFIKNYGGCYDDFVIDELNRVFSEIFPFKDIYRFSNKLESITKSIVNFK